jgi:hypothetical protein
MASEAPDRAAINVTLRVNLAVQHMLAAARFSRAVGALEQQHKGEAFGAFWEEILHNSIASTLACVASLEAYANELFFDRSTVFPGYTSDLLDRLWEAFEQKPTLEKFSFALLLRSKPGFSKGARPYQDVAAVIELRNALTHFKPEWDNEATRHRKLSDLLRGRFPLSPFVNDRLIFPRNWATHGCTTWAVKSALVFARKFEQLSELERKYGHGDRKLFRP